MILEAYFKLWRGWSKTQGQKVISDTSLPQKLKDNNLHKSGKCRPMWPKICPNDQIGLAMGTLHWREHNIWLNEWQKNHFCFLYKNPTQRCSRRQLDYRRQPSFDEGGHDTEKKLPPDMTWQKAKVLQRHIRFRFKSSSRWILNQKWYQHVKIIISFSGPPDKVAPWWNAELET